MNRCFFVVVVASLWDLQMTERMENEIEYDMSTNEKNFPKKKIKTFKFQ